MFVITLLRYIRGLVSFVTHFAWATVHKDTSSKFYSTCKKVCFMIFWVLFCLLCALPGDLTIKIRDLALCISCK